MNYLFKNVGCRWQLLTALLESNSNTIDIIFIQEAPYIKIRNIPSLNNIQGDELWGFPKHPAWESIDMSSKYKETQVVAYVNKRIAKTHFISIDETTFMDPNILFFSIAKTNKRGHRTSFCSFINVYAHPSSKGTHTRQQLLQQLPRVSKTVALIQGDFNIHSSLWDDSCTTETGTAGVNFYSAMLDNNFQLLNRDDESTWFREGDIPWVLDLVFFNNSLARQDVADHLQILDEKFDHRTLSLKLAMGRRTTSGRAYIKADSDEEFAFLQNILATTPYWTCLESAQDKTTSLMTSIVKVFNERAKVPNPKSSPTMWWTDNFNRLKDIYIQSPTKTNRAEYYKAIKQVKKEYFGKKFEEMCETSKPWEGVRWTRDRPLSTIPRFISDSGESITTTDDLWPILDKQFNSGSTRQININWKMINDLPTRPQRQWYRISSYEITEAIKTTTNSSSRSNIFKCFQEMLE
ncbi:hypothetical protein AX15_003762 [Amanita polypyramis BW_CC]|nr:hypothetical protein AX15_003762 [Amanita polypyramis BW_CC]